MAVTNPTKILVFAKHAELPDNFMTFLQQNNYHAQILNDPEQALSMLLDRAMDAVLFYFNQQLPDHISLLTSMCQNTYEVPVVLVTEVVTARDVNDLLRMQVTGVFRLPLSTKDYTALSTCINRHVSHTQAFIENAKMRKELELDQQAGRLVQESLLPPPKQMIGSLVIERFMKSSLYMSGDIVDYLSLPNGQLLFYLADVSGHGTSSALLTVLVKTTTHNILSKYQQFDSEPDDLVTLVSILNTEITQLNISKHLTMFIGIISSDKTYLSYVVCGHYPMPVIQQNNSTRLLAGLGDGFPLGLIEDTEFTCHRIALAEDFKLLVCTDGVIELLVSDPNIDQETAFLTMIKDTGCHIDGLINGLELQDEQPIPDDIAILSIMGGAHVSG